MSKLKSFEVKSYRGIDSCSFNGLSNLNLFIGNNNAGKTSILEALQLMSDNPPKSNFLTVSKLRERSIFPNRYGTSSMELLNWLFPTKKHKDSTSIRLSFEKDEENFDFEWEPNFRTIFESQLNLKPLISNINQEELNYENNLDFEEEAEVKMLGIKLKVKRNNDTFYNENFEFIESEIRPSLTYQPSLKSYHCRFISSVDHRMIPFSARYFNNLIKSGNRDLLIEILREFDEKIHNIELLMDDGVGRRPLAVPYIAHEDLGLVPMSMFGDGLRKAVTLAAAVISSKSEILLIDEIETGIHTDMMSSFFEWFNKLCEKYNVQVFATTHSLEALDGLLKINQDKLKRLVVFRLEKKNEITKVKRFSGEQLHKIRFILGQEVR
ncbi:MAG: AAA family ATPase [Bacillota bacterium]